MKFLQYVIAVCVLAGSSFAFRAKGRAPSATRRQIYLNLQMHSEFIAKMQKIMLASAVGISIGVQSSPVSSFSFPVLSSAIPVARADYRAQQKSTYFRFSPKLIAGRAFFKYELKKAIDSGDWKAVEKFFELYPSKINKNDPNQIDAYDSYLNSNIIRPMKVLAGSFAERGSSVKQRNLLEQEEAFEAALSNLEGCIKDRKGSGFFAPTIKKPSGSERTKQALDAWTKANSALDEYVKVLNNGLMLELNKIPV